MTTYLQLLNILIWSYVLMFADGISVTINKNIIGKKGTNGTYIECSYSRENVRYFTQVIIQTCNDSRFVDIVSFDVNYDTYITSNGKYLKDRIAFDNITNDSNKAKIRFTELLCVDERSYRCHVKYVPKDTTHDNGNAQSETSDISVQVDPSVPDKISYSVIGNSSINSVIFQTGNCSSHDDLLQEGDTIGVLCDGNVGRPPGKLMVIKIENSSAVHNLNAETTESSTLDNCSFYHNSIFTVHLTSEDNGALFRCAEERFVHINEMSVEAGPLDVKYQVRTPVIKRYSNGQGGSAITLRCSSSGNPLPEYTWYRSTNKTSDIWEIYANNTKTISLTNVFDSGSYRCDVSNTIGCVKYQKNTTLNISFEMVSSTTTTPTTPTTFSIVDHSLRIAKTPDLKKYTEGTSIQLQCFSLDFPNGIYRWLLPDSTVFNGSLFILFNANKSQSGVYTCLIIEPSIQFVTENIIIGDPETTSFQCAISSKAIIGSVSGILGLGLLIFGVFYLRRRSKKMSGSDHGRRMTTFTIDHASNNYEGMGEDRTVHHYDDLRIKQEQQYYNTQVKTRR